MNWAKAERRAEVGYWIQRKHWGKGYGTEALRLICAFAFKSLRVHRIEASVVDGNNRVNRSLGECWLPAGRKESTVGSSLPSLGGHARVWTASSGMAGFCCQFPVARGNLWLGTALSCLARFDFGPIPSIPRADGVMGSTPRTVSPPRERWGWPVFPTESGPRGRGRTEARFKDRSESVFNGPQRDHGYCAQNADDDHDRPEQEKRPTHGPPPG